jgi:hypothetical protein
VIVTERRRLWLREQKRIERGPLGNGKPQGQTFLLNGPIFFEDSSGDRFVYLPHHIFRSARQGALFSINLPHMPDGHDARRKACIRIPCASLKFSECITSDTTDSASRDTRPMPGRGNMKEETMKLTRENLTKKTDAQLRDLFARALRRQAAASCRSAFNDASYVIRIIGSELARRGIALR